MSGEQQTRSIYLDLCCLNRPFDDQTQPRIRLETEAVTLILGQVRAAKWRWITSEALDFELAAGPVGERRRWIEQLLSTARAFVPISPELTNRAKELVALGIRAIDALHLACPEHGKADVLLTTDDQFLRVAQRNAEKLKIAVQNPVRWLEEARPS